MLGKLILFLLQIVVAWLVVPVLFRAIPLGGAATFSLFVLAILFAIVVFLTGVLGAQVLQGVGGPSSATLSASLVVALIFAAVLFFVPGLISDLGIPRLSNDAFVLAGALLGYWIKR